MKIMIVLLTCFVSNAFACGGKAMSEADIMKDPNTQISLEKVESLAGEELTLKKIIMSGNNILDINGNAYASAMCDANYINLYYVSARDSRVVCHTRALSDARGSLKLKLSYCYLANGSKTKTFWY